MKRENVSKLINLWQAFTAGVLAGFGILAAILKRRGHLPDDPVLFFWIIIGIPVFVLVANLPGICLRIADGIKKVRHRKE